MSPQGRLLPLWEPAMGGAALVLWMNSIGKDNHFVCSQFPHQGLILGDKRSLFGLISLRGQQLRLFILEPQTTHHLGSSRKAVALTVFRQNVRADLIYVACRMFAERGFQNPFLLPRQMPLSLAVVLQAEK